MENLELKTEAAELRQTIEEQNATQEALDTALRIAAQAYSASLVGLPEQAPTEKPTDKPQHNYFV